MDKKHATIRDVAKEAGVSITTVSQVVKGIGRYSAPTIKRVWTVVNELGYVPNAYALKLFSRLPAAHTQTGLLMRISYIQSSDLPNEEFLSRCMWYFETACQEHGRSGTYYLYRHQLGFRNSLLVQDLVDGVILGLPHRDIIEMLRKRLPTVLTDVAVDPEEVHMPVVNCDMESCYREVIRAVQEQCSSAGMLILRGVAHNPDELIYAPDTLSRSMERAAAECGMALPPDHIIDIEIDPDSNEAQLTGIMDRVVPMIRNRGVRIVCLHAIWPPELVKRMLEQRGIRIPGDAVIMTQASLPIHIPGVVGITQDWKALTDCAVDVLCRRIAGNEPENRKYLVPCLPPEIDIRLNV